jgi:integrase
LPLSNGQYRCAERTDSVGRFPLDACDAASALLPGLPSWVHQRRKRNARRHDAVGDVRRGKLRAFPAVTVREAAEAWLEGAEDGTIRGKGGKPYKRSVVGSYRTSLHRHVLPEVGARKLGDLTLVDVQDLADRLTAKGLNGSTVRNAIVPLRVVYRRALTRGEVAVNPTAGVQLPEHVGRRERIATPEEAAALLATLREEDRPLWAAALYGGLRRGELGALRWQDVDFKAGLIRIERSFDYINRVYVEPKSKAGRRAVPMLTVLHECLAR